MRKANCHTGLQSATALILHALFMAGCTLTFTQPKNPEFKITQKAISDSLGMLVTAEGINLDGRETHANGKTSTNLEVNILNGKNLPGSQPGLGKLGNKIALLLKQQLKDSLEYDNYYVTFTEQFKTGVLTKAKTVSFEYAAGELK